MISLFLSKKLSEDVKFDTMVEDGHTYFRYVRTVEGVDSVDGKPCIHELPAPWMRSEIKAQFAFVEEFPGYAVRTIFGDGEFTWRTK